MKHFRLLKHGVNTRAIMMELETQPNAWHEQIGRQSKVKVQRESESIPLRGLVKSKVGNGKKRDVQESRYTSLSQRFPSAVAFITSTAKERGTTPGRAKLVRLRPGCKVYPHIDRGAYYEKHDRFHLVIKSEDGSYLRTEEEEIRMKEGELWWFDNKRIHEAYNDSAGDRIHLIFDLASTVEGS